jgi:GNAT superfamily N-acetyltransferase
MREVKVKTANHQDAKRIIRLAWTIWPEWYGQVIGPEQVSYMLGRLYQEEAIAAKMRLGRAYFLLTLAGRDAGFFAAEPNDSQVCRLENLYLLQEFRGKGLGKTMLSEVIRFASSLQCTVLQCNVNRFNPAVDFYRHAGFEIVKEADIPFGPFFLNDFIMEKKILAAG